MGCAASKKSLDSSDGKPPQFTDATGGSDDDDEEAQGDAANSRREIDRAAIEKQSHLKGEQSLLALAMNGKSSSVGGDGDKYASMSLKVHKIAERSVSEASPREGGIADATTAATAGSGGGAPLRLDPATSPIKIRIQKPVSSVISIEEHEGSKLLPDVKYSMRASVNGGGGRLHLEHGPGETANTSTLGGGYNPHAGQQQHQVGFPQRDMQQQQQQQMPVTGVVPIDRMQYTQQFGAGRGGGSVGDAMMPRGRGAGRGFAGSISPLHRGPIQVQVVGVATNGFVGRGGIGGGTVVAGPRGIPRPLHVMAARSGGSQRGQTAAFRQPEADHHPAQALSVLSVTVKKSNDKGSDASGNDDDEVGDWDLDDELTEEDKHVPRDASPSKAVSGSSTSFKKQPPMPIQTSSPMRASEPPSPKKPSKFRPTHENANDFGDFVTVGDDDDDSNYGDDNEDVEDWFEADSPTAATGTTASKAKKLPTRGLEGSPTKLVPTSPAAMHASSSSPSVSPAMTPTAYRHTPPLGTEALKPPPMQRLPSRQTVATLGNPPPTKPAAVGIGSPTVGGGSPLKQVSYRSSIMNIGQPVLLPMAIVGSSAIIQEGAAGNAPIRDTKVVKKKRAELPQRNLPHPTPKFGDWLNSRTMINNYIILESLGSGSYAEVKLCKEKVSGKLYAMKFINRDIMKKDKLGKQSKLDDIKREIAIMKKLNHPNVLRLYEVMDDPNMNKLFLVLEYMKHGDLLSHQKKKHSSSLSSTGGVAMESLHDRDLHCVVLQVLLGLAYLHEQKIVHGDIKPQNILVGDKDAVKIADFSISQSLYGSKQKLTDTAGTPAFMSPEMCSGEEYSGQMADIWAVGATIFMLKFGNPPFVAKSAMQMFEKIQSDPLVFPFSIDTLLQDLLSGMMIKDPQKRMTLLEVMSHPWVTKEETLSGYSIRQQAPQITVSSDEIEHAIDSKDQFAIIVNIRIQMMKRLQKARQETLERQRRLRHEDDENANFGARPMAEKASPTDTQALAAGREEHRKVVKLKSPKIKQNKVHADHHSSGKSSHADQKAEDAHEMLSNEEISYRSQLFSRKKTGSTAAPNGGGGKARDQGNCGFENDADIDSTGQDTDDDDDVLSSDDDETAIAQSPQLLDELLLTTLSMPPLTKTKSTGEETHKQDLGLDDRRPFQKDGTIVQPHAAPMIGDKEGYYGESSTLALRFGVASLQGRRSTQEDRWIVLPEIEDVIAPKWSQSAFVGLFGGRGGEECSNILHEQLHSWIFRDPHDLTLTPAILQTCFEELDTYVCDYLLQKGDLSGSTAACAVLSPSDDGKKSVGIVAHVGDCRLVLSLRNNEVHGITEDHRLATTAERDRILQLGGRVVNNRVNGVMAITRAFGDLEFKGLVGKKSGGGGASLSSSSSPMSLIPSTVQQNPFQKDEEKIPALLTARPDVHMIELDPAVHEFMLLACDGLWDVMSSEEAAEIFRDRLHFHQNLQLAAKELAQEAIRRYSNDNITVIAIQVGGGHPK